MEMHKQYRRFGTVLVTLGGLAFCTAANAQAPTNDECEGAITITCGSSGTTNNCTATKGADDPFSSCTFGADFGSVYFKFQPTATSARIRTDLNSVAVDSEFAVYEVNQSNICDETQWSEVGCADDDLVDLCFNGDICVEGLDTAKTYVVVLFSFSTASCGSYTVNIECPCSGTAVDNCPSDPNKTEPGVCGCGVADTDSDSDGTPDCNDGCAADPNKTAPGVCGCGVADTDSDLDGTPDCNDGCAADPNKTAPGVCGCGVADTDSDGDGTPDCCTGDEQCGQCERCDLGTNACVAISVGSVCADTGVACTLTCSITAGCIPGVCCTSDNECGQCQTCNLGTNTCVVTPDCCTSDNECGQCESCDLETNTCAAISVSSVCADTGVACTLTCSIAVGCIPGVCCESDNECGQCQTCNLGTNTCVETPDCCTGDEQCGQCETCDLGTNTCVAISVGSVCADTGVACTLTCSITAGCIPGVCCTSDNECGQCQTCNLGTNTCVVSNTDTDGDGTPDCNDGCPMDADKTAAGICGCGVSDTDSDGDGTPDCDDGCPGDPDKTDAGICGCGVPDTDTDGDGVPDCIDACPGGSSILISATMHIVGSGSHPGSTKEPLVGIEVCAYDKSEGSCARISCGGISHQQYECIATMCPTMNCCTTDANGECNLDLQPGDYVIISVDATKTVLPDPLGVSAGDLLCGEQMHKHLQQIVKSDGKKVPGKTTRRTGSELLIIEAEFIVWDGTEQLYPFVFETVGDWGITASVAPPEGFVSDYDSLSVDADNEIQTVQFTITEVGSELVPTGTTFEVTHRGRSEIIHSQVGIFLTPEYAQARGFNVARLRARGLIKERPGNQGQGNPHGE